ncbi:MAG: response regulator [Treponema sp.]|nr:response regulator [Treponema sp.]
MKYVQILVVSPLLRDYLRNKLEEYGIDVIASATPMEAIAKMRSLAPELLILDYNIGAISLMELLKKKKSDVNTAKTPVIILAEKIEQRHLIELAPYNVKNVFTKPIKVDALFTALSKILKIDFKIDNSKSIVEANVNEGIIFIEIANGFNRDKIDLLRYKVDELCALYRIRIPKVIIMLSDIRLTDINSLSLYSLLQVVYETSRASPNNVKILARDENIRKFVLEQKDFSKTQVVDNLNSAIDSLLAYDDSLDKEELALRIGSQMIQAKTRREAEEMSLKFYAENKGINIEFIKDSLKGSRIAIVDDDFIIQEMIKNTFENTGAIVNTFSDGEEFVAIVDTWEFDLVFIDLNMPVMNGFQVLKTLQDKKVKYPIIVLSSVSTRDSMLRAIQMGVKSYIIKPLTPEDIFIKTVEIMKANF